MQDSANSPARTSGHKLSVRCIEFKALQRNTLKGFATIAIDALRLEVRDVSIHRKGTSAWAALPSKPQIKNGELVKDPDTGKIAYVPILQWSSRQVADAFSRAAIAAVLERDPTALDDGVS
jgi:hypothetical protein